jgi:hypothetical protein
MTPKREAMRSNRPSSNLWVWALVSISETLSSRAFGEALFRRRQHRRRNVGPEIGAAVADGQGEPQDESAGAAAALRAPFCPAAHPNTSAKGR